jgi:NAD(P)-dependent dehydrogenase (short-subunit alcohol dehydrogenase family)
MEENPLTGLVSLVTGAGRGIGRAVAIALSKAGSAVVLGSRTMAELEEVRGEITRHGGTALVKQVDVTDMASVKAFVDAAVDSFGHVDVLVNNAGSNNGGAVGPLWEVNPEAWWHDVEVNLRGAFLCTHLVLGQMIARGSGYIVNITSMGPATRPWPFNVAYACSKAAQIRLTDSVAEEVRGRGVYVFALSPGRVQTQMADDLLNTDAGRRYLAPLMKDLGNPEILPEIPAQAIVFLVGGGADQLSGRILRAGWDLQDLARQADEIVENDRLALRLTGPP